MSRVKRSVHSRKKRRETLDRAKAKRPGSYQIYRPNVEREALRHAAQELGGGAERGGAQSHRGQELHQGLAHGRVVVDHEDQGLRVGGVRHQGSWGW